MKVVVHGNTQHEWVLTNKPHNQPIEWVFTQGNEALFTNGDVYFNLLFDETNNSAIIEETAPVFVNAVTTTLAKLPTNAIRINGWNGFLERSTIEVCGNNQDYIHQIMQALGWQYQLVPDTPGMIAPRILAMIINEAYFGLEDKIAHEKDIDIAMQLGTNYPLGPFEWAEKIGLNNIYHLLQSLAKENSRYTPCKLLQQSLNTQ